PPLSAPSPRRMPQPPVHYSADGEPKPVEAPPHDQPREPETARSSAPAPRAHPPISTRIAQISHCCMTCRDFRPVNGGERGRCENHFAFEEPREVSRDGIACQSTIGDWWTAADDWWLQQADISHHGRPTPQFNELLHELLLRRRDGRT
ncbi:MAG TPA: hypothetical protein VFN80_06865, partial [Acidothermaceae bacterium]|nr:hypothetical protein [Acidothermaceae bacterium]